VPNPCVLQGDTEIGKDPIMVAIAQHADREHPHNVPANSLAPNGPNALRRTHGLKRRQFMAGREQQVCGWPPDTQPIAWSLGRLSTVSTANQNDVGRVAMCQAV